MFDTFFKKYSDYRVKQKADTGIIKNYKNKLPYELIEFWEKFGFGIYMDGYLKIVNPNEYQSSLNEGFNNPNNKEIVFAVTAFGDYLLWTGDAIRLVKFRYGTYEIIETGDDMTWFFDMDLANEDFVKHNLSKKNYETAKEKLGYVDYDECYGYTPILAAGGAEKVENLEKVKIKEHISIISQIAGKIE